MVTDDSPQGDGGEQPIVANNLPQAEARQSHFRELFRHVVETYRTQLNLTGPAKLSEQIRDRLAAQKRPLDFRTIEFQLDRKLKPQKPNRNARKVLIEFVVEGLKGKVPGCDATWFEVADVAALINRIEQDIKEHALLRTTSATRETVVGIKIPTRPNIVARLKNDLGHRHFISYRFALESGNTDKIAREVVTFLPVGENIEFLMSFKFGETDRGHQQQTFRGPVMPLGQSLMCVGVHANVDDPDRDTDLDRGRCLFMYRNAFTEANKARFGMLSTTRAERGFEPCAACIVMFRVETLIGEDEIDEFRQRVTIIRSLADIVKSDFSTLDAPSLDSLNSFLDNRPRGTSNPEDGPPDKVLKIWYDRFEQKMPIIQSQLYGTNMDEVPFRENWRETQLLAEWPMVSPPLALGR